MKYVSYVWQIVAGLIFLAVAIGFISVATTRFETVVLAGMVVLYSAVLFNFSVIALATDVNNHAGFVRFRILATAQGITENEDGSFLEQEKTLAERLKKTSTAIDIKNLSNAAVSLYALFKIIQAIFFT